MNRFSMFRVSLLMLCLGLSSPAVRGLAPDPDGNDFQRDFMRIMDVLKEKHPGVPRVPLPMLADEAMAAEQQRVMRRLAGVTETKDFYFIVMEFLAKLNDGHMKLFYPVGSSRYLPLGLTWFGDRLYVTNAWDKRYRFLERKEVESIAGLPVLRLEKMVNSLLPTDSGNLFHLRKEMFGNAFFMVNEDLLRYLKVPLGEVVRVGYREDGAVRETDIAFARLTEEPGGDPFTRNEITRCRRGNFFSLHEELSTVYFQFSGLQEEMSPSFFEDMFAAAKEKKAGFLVVDLRDASGGNVESMIELFRYLLDRPKECYLYRCWARKGAGNELQFAGVHVLQPAGKELRFDGRLVVFMGKTTFSAGTFPVVLAKDNGFGLLLGEPCGNNSIRYGETERIKLPGTGMTFQYSTRIWERARPGAAASQLFIEPDMLIVPTIEDYVQKRDPLWDYFARYIAGARRSAK